MKTTNYVINDYISNEKALKEKLLNSTTNIYLEKSDTGMGGSSIFLEAKDMKIMLVQPLTGMIEGKLSKYSDNPNISFVCGGSKVKFADAISRISIMNHGVICTTAESLNMYNESIKDLSYLKDYLVVIDESDCYATTEYRSEAFYKLHQLLVNKSFGRVIATTATPLADYMDMPNGVIDEIVKVSRKVERNKEIKLNNYLNINEIVNIVNNGEKVVIFTNDEPIYNAIINNKDLESHTVQCLTSDGIAPKLNPKTKRTQEDISFAGINPNANIYICSTKYLIGFDMNMDAHVYITTNDYKKQRNHECKNHNEIVQAYGRIRQNVLSATVIVNGSASDYNMNLINDLYSKNMNESQHSQFMCELNKQLLCDTYDIDILTKRLEAKNFKVINKIDENIDKLKRSTISFPIRQNNLRLETDVTFRTHLNTVLLNLDGDMDVDSKFSFTLACDYAIALYMRQTGDYSMLDDKDIRMDRVINKIYPNVDIIEDKNAREVIRTAYYIYNFEKHIEEHGKANIMKAYDLTSEVLDKCVDKAIKSIMTTDKRVATPGFNSTQFSYSIKYNDEWININQFINIDHNYLYVNVERDIRRKLAKYDESIIKKAIEKAKYITKELSAIKNYSLGNYLNTYNMLSLSMDNQKKLYINYLKYLLVKNTTNNPVNFRVTKKDDREYNPLTKVAGCLRDIIPSGNQMLDIVAANPTFINYVANSNIGGTVYENIMVNQKCTRKEAKVKYNTMLNTINLPFVKYYTFFNEICGYNENEAKAIVNYMFQDDKAKTKGGMFRAMTKIEKLAIQLIIKELDITNYTRLHDAIMIHDTIERDLNKVISDAYMKVRVHKEF